MDIVTSFEHTISLIKKEIDNDTYNPHKFELCEAIKCLEIEQAKNVLKKYGINP